MMPCARAETPAEERFFAECPHRNPIRLHHEARAWDLHTVLYSTMSVAEIEVLRAADWTVDLALPGASRHPFQRMTQGIRAGYDRLPPWRVRQRVGEFVDALQLPELSFGDAAAIGGTTGPGSGMLVRVNKLTDWVQHVVGDVNGMAGRIVGRSRGLMTWLLPGRAVDGAQGLLVKTFHRLSILVGRGAEHAVSAVEIAGEQVVNVGRRRPHEQDTVFLRLPLDVYQAHLPWMRGHRSRLVAGPAERFAGSTHAALAHHRRPSGTGVFEPSDLPDGSAPPVVVMTTVRVMSRAPKALKAYVVPAAWILEGSGH